MVYPNNHHDNIIIFTFNLSKITDNMLIIIGQEQVYHDCRDN